MSSADPPAVVADDGEASRPNELSVQTYEQEPSGRRQQRFAVETVEEPATSDGQESVSLTGNTLSPSDSHASQNRTTLGYNTAEAVPMTVFYRNLSSQAQAKSRPTLADLHQEIDHDDHEQVNAASHLLEQTGSGDGLPADNEAAAVKFGWVKGVLVRCLLNIWGVMLFLRLSWVVGQAGIGLSLVVILLATVVTTVTTLSMSAICTNGEVRGGGAYYLISRSLGPEVGGAIGIIFSIANAVAVSMYVVGFGETVGELLKDENSQMVDDTNDVRIIGLITVTLLLAIAIIGMEWEARAQLFLLGMLLIAIVNFFIGSFIGPKSDSEKAKGFKGFSGSIHDENFSSDFRGEDFFSVFAVFFPAATGILAGANISGDLKNAQKSIPKGTLLAIALSSALYMLMAWVVGASVMRDASGYVDGLPNNLTYCIPDCKHGLLNTYQNMELVSGQRYIITAGIFSATLSSALASLVGAPKVFQAVTKDRLFPYIHFFEKGSGRSGTEPHRGYILTYFIAIGFILIAKLNSIAPIISNFFLMSYALINFACFNASFSKTPGWRPAFKYYSMWMALFGALLCLAVMFIINWWTALLTLALVVALYKYIDYKKPKVNWGSSGQALMYTNALRFCAKLELTEDHVKNYRPQFLVLTGTPSERPDLVFFASHITKNVAMMICGHVIVGESDHNRQQVIRERLNRWLLAHKVKAFLSVIASRSLRDGASAMMQVAGLGKMHPNILMMGYRTDWLHREAKEVDEYVNIIHDAFDLQLGVAILRLPGHKISNPIDEAAVRRSYLSSATIGERLAHHANVSFEDIPSAIGEHSTPEPHTVSRESSGNVATSLPSGVVFAPHNQQRGTVDVWWLFDDGGLTILIPHLLSLSSQWRHCKLRIFTPGSSAKITSERLRMATLLKKFRIEFNSVEVITDLNKRPTQLSINKFSHLPIQDELKSNRHHNDKLLRQIRLGELLRAHSRGAALIVVTLPIARKSACSSAMYMSWLEAVTADQASPVLIMRGNQTNVITFYS